MSSNTQEYTERLQHWARISFSPQQHNFVAQSRLVKHLAPAFFFAFASRCLFAALQLASALRCLFSMVPTARNTSASAPQPATSSRWLFAAAPLPASASRCLFSMVPTARNTSASAHRPATSSRWLFAAAPLPATNLIRRREVLRFG